MSLYLRNNTWWYSFTSNKQRISGSTGSTDKKDAQRIHDEIKVKIWRGEYLGEKPEHSWKEAVVRDLKESSHLKTNTDRAKDFARLDPYFGHLTLKQITKELVESFAYEKEKAGISPARINRLLSLVKKVLRKAVNEWSWLERVPYIRMRKEPKGRIRFLKPEEVKQILQFLPEYLQDLCLFAIATGLREKNITQLEWENVFLDRGHIFIPHQVSKNGSPIPVPLNTVALAVLEKQKGKHTKYVFTREGVPIKKAGNDTWRTALKKAGITDFRWHDLRHTWASWFVMAGGTLHELKDLGGWKTLDMPMRYSHLSSTHLQTASNKITSKLLQIESSSSETLVQ